jgi:hypothetical protein
MVGSRLQKGLRRALMGALVLTLPLGLTACFGPPTTPTQNLSPVWDSTSVSFFHSPVPSSGTTTGWVTTVTVPPCRDSAGPVAIVASVNNGFLVPLGGNQYSWTRAVTGSPATRVLGTFTADCKDASGAFAHPTLVAVG